MKLFTATHVFVTIACLLGFQPAPTTGLLVNTLLKQPHHGFVRWRGGSTAEIPPRERGVPLFSSAASVPSSSVPQNSTNGLISIVSKLKKEESSKISSDETQQAEAATTTSAAAVPQMLGVDRRFSTTVGIVEFFNVFAQTIPIILMPIIATEQSLLSPASFVAVAASMSTFGAGVGKLFNGYICQVLGGGRAMSIYMTAIAATLVYFSTNTSPFMFGWILALLEFFLSMQWSACCATLANHFEGNPVSLTNSITTLSFMSMAGVLVGKAGGTAILPLLGSSWRSVANFGAVVSLCGAALSHFFLSEKTKVTKSLEDQPSFIESFKAVITKPVFWIFAFIHGTLFLSRTSDRILGSFYAVTSGLPESMCGGLTTSITVGFIHGLSRGRIFPRLQGVQRKLRFIRNNYAVGAASTLGLAFCGGPWFPELVASKPLRAAIIAALSGVMASTLSFQFFQIPGIVAPQFGANKAVFFSLINGAGYFSATLVWAVFGKFIHRLQYGWSIGWLMLASLYASGGLLLLRNFGPLLAKTDKDA